MNETSDRHHPAAFLPLFVLPRSPVRRLQRVLGLVIWMAGLLIWLSGGFYA